MKGGRRKEAPPDPIPVTRISSFKLFNPLCNFGTFHDPATLLAAQTGMAGKKIIPPEMIQKSPFFFDRGLISWSIYFLTLISATTEIKGGLSWNRH